MHAKILGSSGFVVMLVVSSLIAKHIIFESYFISYLLILEIKKSKRDLKDSKQVIGEKYPTERTRLRKWG